MKNLFWSSLFVAAGLMLTGCGPKNQSNGNVGATASANAICPAGYWYSNGQCYNGNSSQGATGYPTNGFYADNYSGTTTLSITDPNKIKDLFKLGMGVCDRAANNYGQANCDSYVMGYHDIIIQLPSSTSGTAIATIIARPRQDPYFNFYGQFPNAQGLLGLALGWITGIQIPDQSYYYGATRNPLQIQMAVSPTNNNQGFQASGYTDAATGLTQTVISIRVENGNVNQSSLTYKLMLGNTPVAQGTMRRCQTINCGL